MANPMAVFNTHRIQVDLPSWQTEIIIQPFGDVHRHEPGCDEPRWHRFLKWARENHTPHTYYIGMGDTEGFMSKSERKKVRDADLHDSTVAALDGLADTWHNRMLGELEFMRGNLLGLVQGNHDWTYENGQTGTQRLAEALGCKWLGGVGYVRMSVTFGNTGTRQSIDIVAVHGRAGGKLSGTSINQVEDLTLIFPDADIYIAGHDHRRYAVPRSVLHITSAKDGLEVQQKRQWLCRSGSFLKGYVEGESSYIVSRYMRPCDLGVIRGSINFHRESKTKLVSKDIGFFV